jgi:hypothetical protein
MLHVTNLHRADRILERGLGQPNVAADLHANLNRIFFSPQLSMYATAEDNRDDNFTLAQTLKATSRDALPETSNKV